VKRIREDEPAGVVIHMCMKTTQGNSLCHCLYLKLAKISSLSFYLLFFSSTKSETQGQNRFCGWLGGFSTGERGEEAGKWVGG
jgi:hypothetical protein